MCQGPGAALDDKVLQEQAPGLRCSLHCAWPARLETQQASLKWPRFPRRGDTVCDPARVRMGRDGPLQAEFQEDLLTNGVYYTGAFGMQGVHEGKIRKLRG